MRPFHARKKLREKRDSCALDLWALSRAAMVGRCGQLVAEAGNDSSLSQAAVGEGTQWLRISVGRTARGGGVPDVWNGENGTCSWRWRSRAERKARGWWLDERSWDVEK